VGTRRDGRQGTATVTSGVTTGAKEPQVRPPAQQPSRSLPGGVSEFESPTQLPRALRASQRDNGHPGTGLTLRPSWSRRRQARAWSLVPAVPPTCHKQRSRAVSSGQSRSLRGGRDAVYMPLTWSAGGGRNCMACKESRLGSALPCPAGRSGPFAEDRSVIGSWWPIASRTDRAHSRRLSAIYRSEGLVCFGVTCGGPRSSSASRCWPWPSAG
jgi:hypothetical protein